MKICQDLKKNNQNVQKKIKLGIDASRSVEGIQKTGVEMVSDEIVKRIMNYELRVKEKEVEFVFYTPKLIEWLPKEKQKILNWPFRYLWTQIRLGWEILFHPPDTFFIPVHTIPILSLVTCHLSLYKIIHDIAFKIEPQVYGFWQKLYLNFDLLLSVKKCKKIFVPTKKVKDDLLKYSSIDENKVVVVHWGYTPKFDSEFNSGHILTKKVCNCHSRENGNPEIPQILKSFWIPDQVGNDTYANTENSEFKIKDKKNIKKKQILYIGRIEEKKNIINLIKAFEIFSQKFHDYKLILAGKVGVKKLEIEKLVLVPLSHHEVSKVKGLEIRNRIKLLGFISEEKKYQLLKESLCLVLVSKQEGFGFPILEAWDFELPVVASDIPVLREIGNDACFYVNPDSPQDIAYGLERIVSDENLSKELVEKGRGRLKNFSWEKTVEKILMEMLR